MSKVKVGGRVVATKKLSDFIEGVGQRDLAYIGEEFIVRRLILNGTIEVSPPRKVDRLFYMEPGEFKVKETG